VVAYSVSMRRFGLIPASLALLQALFVAPYQHVHVSEQHHEHSHHDEAAIVHAHPYGFSLPESHNDEPAFEHSHKPHVSVALDTFSTLAQGVLTLVFVPESTVAVFAPAQLAVWVEITEQCGHDPPCIGDAPSRAPPSLA